MKINNATPLMTNNTNKANKNVAFSGGMPKNARELFVLERKGNMSRYLFTLNAFVFLLGGRLLKSRDKNEKRETLTRDVPTILIAVFGVPVIGKLTASLLQKKSQFAILNDKDDYKKGAASYEQLEDWYKYDENLKSGFEGFTKRLNDKGGDLKKIFSHLGEDIKAELDKFTSKNNDDFVKELAGKSDLKKSIVEAFKKDGNKALEQAKWLKTIPAITGFVVTLFSIGIFVPKLNIAITESINKKKKADTKPADTVELTKTEPAKEAVKKA